MNGRTDDAVATAQDLSARGISGVATVAIAIACGLAVANVYYAQPLLDVISRDFGIGLGAIGLVVTLTQAGYAAGLIFIVPLGDLVDQRNLILGQTVLLALSLIAAASASTEVVFLVAMALVGLLSVLVQLFVAFAATIAAPAVRGKIVGIVTSGVVLGILAARFISGAVTDIAGWRAVYGLSAALMLIMAAVLSKTLPKPPRVVRSESYFAVVRSIPRFFLQEPILLTRGILALLIFATFSTFWTSLVLPLSALPFGFSHTQIGLFGLIGIAGALAARGAGDLADRGFAQRTTGVSLALLLASWGLIARLPGSIPALIIGILLLDFAVQAVHVSNQSIIFERFPNAKSRLVGGYMAFYSVGSGVGAIASTACYAFAGWYGVCVLGSGFSLMALVTWTLTRTVHQRSG